MTALSENWVELEGKQIESPFPIVAVRTRDWMLYEQPHDKGDEFPFISGMICGWLIKLAEDRIVIALESFGQDVRHVVVIPIENVLEIEVVRGKDG